MMKEENESDVEMPGSEEYERKSMTINISGENIDVINNVETNLESNVTISSSDKELLKSSIKNILGQNFDDNIDVKTVQGSRSVNVYITVSIDGTTDSSPEFSQESGGQQLKQLPHMKSRTGKSRLQCKYCGKVMSSDYRLQCHIRKHTGATAGKCKFCGKNFSDRTSLKRHYKTCQREKNFPCELCEKIFNSQKRLDIHIARHPILIKEEDDFTDSIIEPTKDNSIVDPLLPDVSSKPELKCRFCGKVLSNPKTLRYHEKGHTRENPITCLICEKIFYHPQSARNHFKKCGEKILGSEGSDIIKEEIEDCDVKPVDECSFPGIPILGSEASHLNKSDREDVAGDCISPDDRVLKCRVCGEFLEDRKSYRDHMNSQHPGENAVLCQFCGRTYRGKSMPGHLKTCKLSGVDEHIQTTQDKKKVCGVCGKTVHDLRSHMLIHSGEKQFKCSDCGAAFRVKSMLKRHIYSVHSDIKHHKCAVCEKEFKHKLNLTSHMRIHTEKEHPFQCDVCSKCLSSEKALQVHKHHHAGNKKYLCTICGKTFNRSDSYNTHRVTMHNIAKPYPCDDCGRGFLKKCFLTKHKRTCDGTGESKVKRGKRVNTEKSFKCDICPRVLSSRSNLESHMRGHTGERPYVCSVCGKGFMRLPNLKLHAMNHSGERPFKCDQCDKAFRSVNILKNHMRTHTGETPFKCEICNREFNKSENLSRHKKIHDDKRPYECKICGMSFKFVDIFKRHERRHTGEKPFRCSVCDRAFSDARPLKKHMLIHTENKPSILN